MLIAAAAVLLGVAPAAALAKPTASELIELVDGRIPGLERVGEAYDISVSPGGQYIAFIAGIKQAEGMTVDDAVWTITADGATLREVVAETPGSEGYYEHYRAPAWSPSGRYLTYTHSFPHHPRSSTLLVDLTKPASAEPLTLYGGSAAVFSADERFVVARTGGRDGWPGITAFEVASGKKFLAQNGDGIPARAWSWTQACSRASRLGVPPNGSTGQVAAQLSLTSPGCRLLDEPPSAADLTELIDGRIPHLTGFGEVRPSPNGSRIAFVAEIDPPGETAPTDQLWLISLDGGELTRLEASGTRAPDWSSAYTAFSFSALRWQPGTELLAFHVAMRSAGANAIPPYWSVLDLSGVFPIVRARSTDVADERFPEGPPEAEAPSAEAVQLANLIDGRVDGLLSLDEIVTSPDGSQIAFLATAHHPESVSGEDEVWVISADGTGLVPVERLGAGYSAYNIGLWELRISPDGRCLTYRYSSTSGQPRTVVRAFPLDGEGSCPEPKPTPDVPPLKDGLPVGDTPPIEETPPPPASQAPATPLADAPGPAANGLPGTWGALVGGQPFQPAANGSATAIEAARPTGRIVSSRILRRGGRMIGLRAKVSAPLARQLKAYVLLGSGTARKTIGRATTKVDGATTRLTISLKASAKRTLAKRADTPLTLRVVLVGADGKTALVERTL